MPYQADLPNSLRVKDALRWAQAVLATSESDTPRLDSEMLLAHVLDVSREKLYTIWHDSLTAQQIKPFTNLVRRRAQVEPVAYLIGQRPFYDVMIKVDKRVLIPRPETELLVEEVIGWCHAHVKRPRIADVGTGSGAIAIALAQALPSAYLVATDISPAALQVARENLARHGLEHRVSLLCCDLLSSVHGPLDVIVANLPYIPSDRMPDLPTSVRRYEPHQALDGGPQGLTLISRLLRQVADKLAPKALVLLEMDDDQVEKVIDTAQSGLAARFEVKANALPDYAGHRRMVRIETFARG